MAKHLLSASRTIINTDIKIINLGQKEKNKVNMREWVKKLERHQIRSGHECK